MPDDRYEFMKACYEIIDQATGKPKGTTKVGSLQQDDVATMAGRMARAITVLQWGCVACIGLLQTEHELETALKIRTALPFWDNDWNHYWSMQRGLRAMLKAGSEPDLLTMPDVMHEVWRDNGKRDIIPIYQKNAVWNVCRGARWHLPKARQMMQALQDMMLHPNKRYDELQQILENTQGLVDAIDDLETDHGLATGDHGGEGDRPDESTPTE